MAELNKDQQQFWDILKYPHIRDCSNCKYNVETSRYGKGCIAPRYLKLGYPCCANHGGLVNWKWIHDSTD